MPDFNPGDGWREIQQDEVPPTGYLYYCAPQVGDDTDDDSRYWVREEPVPPLPTEIATLDGSDLIFVSEILRALGTWKQALK